MGACYGKLGGKKQKSSVDGMPNWLGLSQESILLLDSGEEKAPSSSFQVLGSKRARGVKVTEALGFMPSALVAVMNAYAEGSDKETHQLLTYIVCGEQEQAEAMLKLNSELLLEKATVTDLSNRTFTDITAFQYALWALDWHMWRMLLKYLTREEAAMQFQELEDKGTAHGKHFSLEPLIGALNSYVQNYDAWDKVSNWTAMEAHWCRQVGGAQLLVPSHVAQEYCHPTRSFVPVPSFTEEGLVRSMKLHGNQGNWYTAEYNGGKLGEKFGIVRYNGAAAQMAWEYIVWNDEVVYGVVDYVIEDAKAVQSLWRVRQQQLMRLEGDLKKSIQNKATDSGQALQFRS